MIPSPQSLMLSYLKVLADRKEWHFQDMVEKLAIEFKVSNLARQEMIPSGQKTFDYHVGTVRTFLKKAGLVESTRHGYVRITEIGMKVLSKNLKKIDFNYLRQCHALIEQ